MPGDRVFEGMFRLLIAALIIGLVPPASAADLRVAAAANFRLALEELAPAFAAATSHRIRSSVGSTGQLAAQILQGAPFDVLLAADTASVEHLLAEGAAVAGSERIYAIGRLVLISGNGSTGTIDGTLTRARRIAIANPKTAPYGQAARAYLKHQGQWEALAGRVILARNVSGAFAAVRTGAADAGIVALSSVAINGDAHVALPAGTYPEIRQMAVILSYGAENPAAPAFLDFLTSPEAVTIIQRHGYDVR